MPVRKAVLGPKAVGSFVPRLTRPAFEKFGFSAATLLTDWATIVGADLARYTAPERLRWPRAAGAPAPDDEPQQGRPGATLILAVDPVKALDIQYKSRQLIERINAYFGYRAVADMRIVQAPIPVKQSPDRPSFRPTAAPGTPVPAEVAAVEDEALRAALERMAAGLSARAAAITAA